MAKERLYVDLGDRAVLVRYTSYPDYSRYASGWQAVTVYTTDKALARIRRVGEEVSRYPEAVEAAKKAI